MSTLSSPEGTTGAAGQSSNVAPNADPRSEILLSLLHALA